MGGQLAGAPRVAERGRLGTDSEQSVTQRLALGRRVSSHRQIVSQPNLARVIHLVRPDFSRHREWLDLIGEFEGAHLDGSSLTDAAVASMADPDTFARWIQQMADQESGRHVPEGRVRCTSRWVARGGELVGMVNLRHELTDALLREAGHIGYAVRPTARRRGVARVALSLMLREAIVRWIASLVLSRLGFSPEPSNQPLADRAAGPGNERRNQHRNRR